MIGRFREVLMYLKLLQVAIINYLFQLHIAVTVELTTHTIVLVQLLIPLLAHSEFIQPSRANQTEGILTLEEGPSTTFCVAV